MQSANNFSPNLSVTANPPVSWLPYTFVNSEVMLWVSDGNPFLRLYRLSTPTDAYAVFLKKRPGSQVQLGPRLFTSIAISQDAAMDMIAKNLFGSSPFRWSELREWKNDMRMIFASNGYGMEEVHHFGAELLMPRRLYLNPPVFWDVIIDISPRNVSIHLPSNRRLCLQKVACLPVPLIWHMPLISTAVWVAKLQDQLKASTLRKFFVCVPPDVLADIIAQACVSCGCVIYVKHARVSLADVFVVPDLATALRVVTACKHVDNPLENYYNYMDSIESNLADIQVHMKLQCRAGNDRIFVDESM